MTRGYASGTRRGKSLRKNKILYYRLLLCLLRFITDITEFYYGEITVLLQGNLFTLERLSQIRPITPTFEENHPKLGFFLLRILRNITDITEFFITEYYGKLRSVTIAAWTSRQRSMILRDPFVDV